jgi:hypothetical protein
MARIPLQDFHLILKANLLARIYSFEDVELNLKRQLSQTKENEMSTHILEWHDSDKILPIENTYVLVRYERDNWGDSHDQEGCKYKVAKFEKGISTEERALMSDSDPRKRTYTGKDQHGSNQKPYQWSEFGPNNFFGQDVKYWAYIPRIK